MVTDSRNSQLDILVDIYINYNSENQRIKRQNGMFDMIQNSFLEIVDHCSGFSLKGEILFRLGSDNIFLKPCIQCILICHSQK